MEKLLTLSLLLLVSHTTSAKELSESQLFRRCYTHITSKRLQRSHPLLKSVKNGSVSATDACIQVFDKARLNSNSLLNDTSDEEAKSVLKNFTNLHTTFFSIQNMPATSTTRLRFKLDLLDEQGSALFYTKALFKTDDIDDILKGYNDIEGIRSEGRSENLGVSSRVSKSLYTYSVGTNKIPLPNLTLVQSGDLIGLQGARTLERPDGRTTKDGDKGLLNSIGGGLLGSKGYLQRSVSSSNISADGADKMKRPWANTVLEDFLCKSLPAARLTDGQRYKTTDGTSSFRKSDGCIQCHVTMDQLAAGGRGLFYTDLTRDNASNTNPNFKYVFERVVDRDDAEIWPAHEDSSYYRRPAKGALFYRTYDGKLINKSFSNFDELASNILATDDYYACVAKKYYEHFTGVSASLADINDPFTTVILNEEDLFHRNEVIKLGKELKETKSTNNLVKSIMKSSVYRQEGYTILEKN